MLRRLSVLPLAIVFLLAVFSVPIMAECPPGSTCLWLPIISKTGAGPAPTGAWPTAFANYQRTGYQPDSAPLGAQSFSGLQLAWSRDLDYPPPTAISAVAVPSESGGQVFFPDSSQLLSLDLETGQDLSPLVASERPKAAASGLPGYARDTLTIQGDMVYYSAWLDNWDRVVAANRITGEIVWTYPMYDPASGSLPSGAIA